MKLVEIVISHLNAIFHFDQIDSFDTIRKTIFPTAIFIEAQSRFRSLTKSEDSRSFHSRVIMSFRTVRQQTLFWFQKW